VWQIFRVAAVPKYQHPGPLEIPWGTQDPLLEDGMQDHVFHIAGVAHGSGHGMWGQPH